MKVLHIESGRHLYGGARQVLYIMEGLCAQGVDNLLACPVGAHIADAARVCARVHEIPMKGDLDLGLTRRIKRLIDLEKPDVVHIHSRRGADVWGGLAAQWAGVPCVLSRRVDNAESRWWVGLKYRLFDHVITISDGIRQVLLSEGLPEHRVSCVRSALDPTPFLAHCDKAALLAKLKLPANALLVGVVAQLIPRKGHRHLLAALPAVLEAYPQVHVLVLGRGPLEDELRRSISQQGLNEHVHLMGFRDDLPEFLGCLDLLVHPADMEGLGISLLQASAAQVPIIASRAGGMPEAVRDGVNGLLIEPGDVHALTTAMIHLLGDEALRVQMGRAGRALVNTEFSIDAMVRGNLTVYRSVLS